MSSRENRGVSCLLWPFVAMWRLVTAIVVVTGRLLAVVAGLVLVLVGVVLSATCVGAVVGIPLMLLGLTLMVRGFF